MAKKQKVDFVVDKVEENTEAVVETKKEGGINPDVIKKLKEAIDDKRKELDDKVEELENKKYLIPGGKDVAKLIKQYVVKEAKWRFTESLGVIEINRAMHEFIQDESKKELMITPLALEALYYFMSKHDGVGLPAAEKFTSLLKAINQAKHRADEDKKEFDKDKKEIEEMQFKLQSLEHGVDPDNPMETLKDVVESKK